MEFPLHLPQNPLKMQSTEGEGDNTPTVRSWEVYLKQYYVLLRQGKFQVNSFIPRQQMCYISKNAKLLVGTINPTDVFSHNHCGLITIIKTLRISVLISNLNWRE
jgi:capsule polysaccharide modification protein KpsS